MSSKSTATTAVTVTGIPYTTLPSDPEPYHHQTVIILPYYDPYHHRITTALRRCLIPTAVLLLVTAAVFFLYPANPALYLSRVRLNNLHVSTASGLPTVDLSFSVSIKVRNRDFFSFDYSSLNVSLSYRGTHLGSVSSRGGSVKARAVSYIDATLDLNGLVVLHDVFYFIEDLAKGLIPFDTVSSVSGDLGIFFVNVPVKGRVACEVLVSAKNDTIVNQNCYRQ